MPTWRCRLEHPLCFRHLPANCAAMKTTYGRRKRTAVPRRAGGTLLFRFLVQISQESREANPRKHSAEDRAFLPVTSMLARLPLPMHAEIAASIRLESLAFSASLWSKVQKPSVEQKPPREESAAEHAGAKRRDQQLRHQGDCGLPPALFVLSETRSEQFAV